MFGLLQCNMATHGMLEKKYVMSAEIPVKAITGTGAGSSKLSRSGGVGKQSARDGARSHRGRACPSKIRRLLASHEATFTCPV